ncbi:carbohydrate ABC transporter permease [Streptomyces sp. L7]
MSANSTALRRKRAATAGFHLGRGRAWRSRWLLPIALVVVTSLRSLRRHRRARPGQLAALLHPRQLPPGLGRRRPATRPHQQPDRHDSQRPDHAGPRLDGRVRPQPLRSPFPPLLLLLMLGGNLLPPQILLIPVSKLSEVMGVFDTLPALIGVQIGFGVGFYVFVLHGFMRSIPAEIQQAAVVDGAAPGRSSGGSSSRLTRPALAALSAPCPSPGSSTTCSGPSPSCAATPRCQLPPPS